MLWLKVASHAFNDHTASEAKAIFMPGFISRTIILNENSFEKIANANECDSVNHVLATFKAFVYLVT